MRSRNQVAALFGLLAFDRQRWPHAKSTNGEVGSVAELIGRVRVCLEWVRNEYHHSTFGGGQAAGFTQ
jgi:hypothetical protein